MDIRIYDRFLKLRCVCDTALRAEASEAFSAPGRCTVTVPLSRAEPFQRERIITVPGMGSYVLDGIRKNGADGTAEITGQGILSLFARRVLPVRQAVSGTAETYLLDLARTLGAAVLSAPLSTLEYGFAETAETTVGGGTLLSAMQAAADAAGLGMRLLVTGDGFLFSVRRPAEGDIRLTRDGGQLKGGVLLSDGRNYANRAVVVGGDGRQITVSAEDDGQPLREILVKAPEITPDLYETDALYLQALRERGRDALQSRRTVHEAWVEVSADAAQKLTLGSVYETEDRLLGIAGPALCREKTLIFDENGVRYTAVLDPQWK